MKLKFLITSLFFFFYSFLSAQNESADFIRSTGKIYVVVAVLLIIFFGIILFLISLERKIARLEKKNN